MSAAALGQCAAAAREVQKRARRRGVVLHANARTAKTGKNVPAECKIKASAIDRGATRAMLIAGRGLGGARPADARARRVVRTPRSARSAAQRAGHARAGQSRTVRTLNTHQTGRRGRARGRMVMVGVSHNLKSHKLPVFEWRRRPGASRARARGTSDPRPQRNTSHG